MVRVRSAMVEKGVTPNWRSSDGLIPGRIGKWLAGMRRRPPVTIRKKLFKTLSTIRVSATGALFSVAKYINDKTVFCYS